jgi:hypothetical protein
MAFVDHDEALRFLHTAYEPDDWVAVFLKSYQSGRIGQRVVPVSVAMSWPFQNWLARESRNGVNVFVSVNAVASRQASRRRTAIGAVRHVFLDADRDGSAVLTAIAAQRDLPAPSYVLHSSPDRVHVFWRAAAFTIHEVEALQKQLARELRTDPAATSCSQTTRLCGFRNQKYRPPPLVTVEYRSVDRVYAPSDFPVPSATISRDPAPSNRIRSTSSGANVIERARRYLAAAPPAVSGQHGDLLTFRICCRLVRGFALSDTDAMAVLAEWNTRCQPPWSERELRRKLQHAQRYGREPIGGLLETQP